MADQNIPNTMAALTIVLLACLAGEALAGIRLLNSHSDENKWMEKISLDANEGGRLPHRIKRSADRSSRSRGSEPEATLPNDNKLNSTTVYLSGTENHTEAYVHWSGNKSEAIFVLTRQRSGRGELVDSKVWWTNNYGDYYHQVNFGTGAKIMYFVVSQVDNSKIIFVDFDNKVLHITEDEMQTNTSVKIPFEPYRLVLHPTNASLVLGYSIKNRELHCSEDFGKTWHLLQSGVSSRFSWAVPGIDTDMSFVHVEVQNSMGEARHKMCRVPDCRVQDTIQSPDLDFHDPTTMLVVKEYIFVQRSFPLEREVHLYVSYKRGPFRRAFFPTDLQSKDFLIVNAEEGQVFLAVSHHTTANLYLSDPSGQFYVLALENIAFVARPGWFDIDLYEVEGLTGVYFVNQVVPRKSPTDFGVKTLVSFDKGGNWQRLNPPADHSCSQGEECYLNLHLGIFSYVLGTVSEEAAPGIIIGHGTVGPFFSALHIGIYHSRDGGLTWNTAPFEGIYVFNILDQGSVITAVQEASISSTDVVHFTTDEGQTWYKQKFQADHQLRVDGVLNEPGITTLMASVYGHAATGVGGWTMVKLDFSTILTRQCNASDYQEWKPPIYQDGCILGERTVFEQRKPNAACKNGPDYKRSIQKYICNCTKHDFECDFGYKEMSTGECQKDYKISANIPVNCTENKSYLQTQGYRKVGGDRCQAGVSEQDPYRATNTTCPVSAPQSLLLSAPSPVVCVGCLAHFSLVQGSGSRMSTNYTWDFNDTVTRSEIGFAKAASVNHTFSKAGLYQVSVTASNSKGSASAHTLIHVVDNITSLEISVPWATKVGLPVTMELATEAGRPPNTSQHLHFCWMYGDEASGQRPVLTWNASSTHTYTQPGVFLVNAEAVSANMFAFRQTSIQVFNEGTLLRLSFSPNIAEFNVGQNLLVRQDFLWLLRQMLADVMGVGESRLAVWLSSSSPAQADVLVLESANSTLDNVPIQQIVDGILHQVSTQKVSVALFGPNDPMGYVSVTEAVVVTDAPGVKPSRPLGPNLRPLYIGVPVLLAVVVVTLLVLAYYKKKIKEVRRYSIIRSRNNSETLLDDDDDPPLDLNPEVRRPTHRQPAEDNLDLGSGSHLVMVTSPNADMEDPTTC